MVRLKKGLALPVLAMTRLYRRWVCSTFSYHTTFGPVDKVEPAFRGIHDEPKAGLEMDISYFVFKSSPKLTSPDSTAEKNFGMERNEK